MPKGYPRLFCRICNKHRDEVGDLSKRGKCLDCAKARQRDSIAQMRHHKGEVFDYWRRRHAAAVGGVLVDDLLDGG